MDDEYTVEDARNEQIAHLRTGIEMLASDLNSMCRKLGIPESNMPKLLLDNDTWRDVAIDKMIEDPTQCNAAVGKHWLPYCPVHGYHPDDREE